MVPRLKKVIKLNKITEVYDFVCMASRSAVGRTFARRNKSRRADSGLRARRMIRWLSGANGEPRTTYFFTATFADDVMAYDEALRRWKVFRRYLVREYPLIRYVAVPEVQPRSGRWHFHAIFCGLPDIDDMRSRHGRMRAQSGRMVDAWQFSFTLLWSKANGGQKTHRANIEVARSVGGVCSYLAKYLVKDVGGVVPVGRRNYYAGGRALRRPKIELIHNFIPSGKKLFEVMYKDRLGEDVIFSRYENEGVSATQSVGLG